MGWQDGTPVEKAAQPAWMQGAPVNAPAADAPATPAPTAVAPASLVDQLKRQLGLTARAGVKGITAIPAMVGDAIGMDSSGAVDRAANMIGLPKPESATERVAGDVAGAIAGTGGMAGAGQALMRAAGPTASSVGNLLQQSIGSQALAAAGGAGGAGMAREGGAGPGGQLAAGIAGAIAPGAVQGAAARVISPNVRPQVRTLMDEGVTPTIGQLMGGRVQVTEDKLTSLPILGDAIVNAKTAGLDQFNRAVYQRALEPIGGDASRFPVGREGVRMVRNALGNAYDDVLDRVTPTIDRPFVQDLARIGNNAQLVPERRPQFNQIIQEQIVDKLAANPTGRVMKEVESELNRLAREYRRDGRSDFRHLGESLDEVRGSIRQMLIRSNPNEAPELRAVDTGFANYARLRNAAGRVGSREGVVTPAQLNAAVRSGAGGVGRAQYSTGEAFMQDLSDAGINVMGGKYPDSGTAGRLGIGLLASGAGAAVSPGALAGVGAASIPYLPGVRQGVAALMTQRPQGAGALADLLRADSSLVTRGALSLPFMQ